MIANLELLVTSQRHAIDIRYGLGALPTQPISLVEVLSINFLSKISNVGTKKLCRNLEKEGNGGKTLSVS